MINVENILRVTPFPPENFNNESGYLGVEELFGAPLVAC